MHPDNEPGLLESFFELCEETIDTAYDKLVTRTDVVHGGFYKVESDRFFRSFLYKCGHRSAPNFIVFYRESSRGDYRLRYSTHVEGDKRCPACAIKQLEYDGFTI